MVDEGKTYRLIPLLTPVISRWTLSLNVVNFLIWYQHQKEKRQLVVDNNSEKIVHTTVVSE